MSCPVVNYKRIKNQLTGLVKLLNLWSSPKFTCHWYILLRWRKQPHERWTRWYLESVWVWWNLSRLGRLLDIQFHFDTTPWFLPRLSRPKLLFRMHLDVPTEKVSIKLKLISLFFQFLLLGLAISKYRQYFSFYKHLSLTTKNGKNLCFTKKKVW